MRPFGETSSYPFHFDVGQRVATCLALDQICIFQLVREYTPVNAMPVPPLCPFWTHFIPKNLSLLTLTSLTRINSLNLAHQPVYRSKK